VTSKREQVDGKGGVGSGKADVDGNGDGNERGLKKEMSSRDTPREGRGGRNVVQYNLFGFFGPRRSVGLHDTF